MRRINSIPQLPQPVWPHLASWPALAAQLVGQLFPSIPLLGGTFGRGWATKQLEQVWEKMGRSMTWGRNLGLDPESRPTWEAAQQARRWGNKLSLFRGAAPSWCGQSMCLWRLQEPEIQNSTLVHMVRQVFFHSLKWAYTYFASSLLF